MQDFPANSQKAARAQAPPPEPKRVERVTSAEAVRRKRGLGRQFKETFVGGNARLALHYMFVEVVIPAVQDTMIDALQGGVERLIRGESARPRRGTPTTYANVGHVDYRRLSHGPPRNDAASTTRMLSRGARERQRFDDILIHDRREAEEVLERLFDILSQYGMVSVAELYAMTGIQSSHTDVKWGWTELRGARITRNRSGKYVLELPDPIPFD